MVICFALYEGNIAAGEKCAECDAVLTKSIVMPVEMKDLWLVKSPTQVCKIEKGRRRNAPIIKACATINKLDRAAAYQLIDQVSVHEQSDECGIQDTERSSQI